MCHPVFPWAIKRDFFLMIRAVYVDDLYQIGYEPSPVPFPKLHSFSKWTIDARQ
jgi:hypothetical protein